MDRSVLEGDPHSVIEGHDYRGLCHRSYQRLFLYPRGISPGSSKEYNRPLISAIKWVYWEIIFWMPIFL